MAEHGGYRKPANPAPVSGPGAHSRRTDGQPVMDLPDAGYGEGQEFRQLQQGASLPTDAQSGGGGSPMAAMAARLGALTPLGAPTGQPDVPVTDGADAGPGRGAGVLTTGLDFNQQDARHLSKYLPVLLRHAESEATPPGFKQWVRSIIANM